MKILPHRRVIEKLFHKIVKVGLRNLKMQSLRTPKWQRWMELISNVPPVVGHKRSPRTVRNVRSLLLTIIAANANFWLVTRWILTIAMSAILADPSTLSGYINLRRRSFPLVDAQIVEVFSGAIIFPCFHMIHKDCAINLVQSGSVTCPMCCRPIFQEKEPPSSSTPFQWSCSMLSFGALSRYLCSPGFLRPFHS